MSEMAFPVIGVGETNHRVLGLFFQCVGFVVACGFLPSLSFRRSSFLSLRLGGALALFLFTAPLLFFAEGSGGDTIGSSGAGGRHDISGIVPPIPPQAGHLFPLFQSSLSGLLLGVGVSASIILAFTAGEWISSSLFPSVRLKDRERGPGVGVLFVLLLLSFFEETIEVIFVIFAKVGVAINGVVFGVKDTALLLEQGGEILRGALLLVLPIVIVTLFLDFLFVIGDRYLSPLSRSFRGAVVSLVGVFLIGALGGVTAAELQTAAEFTLRSFVRRSHGE